MHTVQSGFPVEKFIAINLNATGDAISITGLPAAIIIDKVEILNWSATPAALLAMTLRDASGGGGNSLVGSLSTLNAIITATGLAMVAAPPAALLGISRVVSTTSIYLNVSAANGTALTADVVIYYHSVP